MITTTPSHTPPPRPRRSRFGPSRRAGFTLVELIVAATLAAFVMAGVLSTFLFLGRSGANLRNYSDMEAEARKALEIFAQDVRQASAVTWNSSTSVTLNVNSTPVTYAYSSAAKTFARTRGGTTQILISGVAPNFEFKAYKLLGPSSPVGSSDLLPLATAADRTAASASTKQLQISLEATRSTTTVTTATNVVLSARFVLRNKQVTA